MTDLIGIVACGGLSSRMGKDKSMLNYHGKQQRYFMYEMLEPLCEKVFLSCNNEQAAWITPQYNAIVDNEKYTGIGPMVSVLSAFEKFPFAALLVVGCDYPFITKEHLQQLVANRSGLDDAVFFCHPETYVNEPLLTIYEKNSYPKLLENFSQKKYSLRHFLSEANSCSVLPSSGDFLKSVDDEEAFLKAREIISAQLN